MKALVYTEYGPPDVLRVAEVPKPVPKDGEVLVRIRAASVNPLDWHILRGTPYFVRLVAGWRRPKVARLGVDLAGEVEAVGSNVTQFKAGDSVFGTARGTFAEHVCTAAGALARKPDNLSFEQAAVVPVAAITALQALRDRGRVQRDQRVLINGAGGGVGTFAVQIARVFGAKVTGVCSPDKGELVRSLGARHVIDYRREDFTRSGRRHDVIVDCVGNHSLSECRRALTPTGTLVLVGGTDTGRWIGPLAGMLKAVVGSLFVSQKLLPLLAHLRQKDLIVIQELLASGQIAPVTDRSYALGDVPDAIRYLEEGHARGKVVINVT